MTYKILTIIVLSQENQETILNKILTIIVFNQENQETILNKILTIIVFNQENQETILNYKKYYYQKHMNLKFRFHHLWI